MMTLPLWPDSPGCIVRGSYESIRGLPLKVIFFLASIVKRCPFVTIAAVGSKVIESYRNVVSCLRLSVPVNVRSTANAEPETKTYIKNIN